MDRSQVGCSVNCLGFVLLIAILLIIYNSCQQKKQPQETQKEPEPIITTIVIDGHEYIYAKTRISVGWSIALVHKANCAYCKAEEKSHE